MNVVAGVLLAVWLGYRLVHVCAPRLPAFEKMAVGYAAGLGLITYMLFLFSWAGIPLSLWTAMLPPLVGGLLLAPWGRRRGSGPRLSREWVRPNRGNSRMPDLLEVGCLAGIALLVASEAIQAWYWPIRDYDALQLYDNLGRLFYARKGIALDGYLLDRFSPNLLYPLYVPLSNCFVYLLAGTRTVNPQFLNVLLYLSLLTVFYCRLRYTTPRRMSLVLTLVLASTPFIYARAKHCNTEFPYSCYYSMAVFYVSDYMLTRERDLLRVGAILLALLVWIRPASEIIVMAVIVAAGVHLFSRWDWYAVVVLAGASAALYLPWATYVCLLDVPLSPMSLHVSTYSHMIQGGQLIKIITSASRAAFLHPSRYGITWYLFACAVIWSVIGKRGSEGLLRIICMTLAGYVVTFYLYGVVKGFNIGWEYGVTFGSGVRLLSMLAASILYYIASVNHPRGRGPRKDINKGV